MIISSQTKNKMGKKIFKIRNKKGLSVIVGYVLLIAFAMVMGGLVYYWMKSYIPTDGIKCPEGVSVFIEDYSCDFPRLTMTIKNNGKFNIDGYFIRGANNSNQEIATIDLSDESGGGIVSFEMGKSLNTGDSNQKTFDLADKSPAGVYLIDIIPIRYEVIDNKRKLATCSEARISEKIECIP